MNPTAPPPPPPRPEPRADTIVAGPVEDYQPDELPRDAPGSALLLVHGSGDRALGRARRSAWRRIARLIPGASAKDRSPA